MKLKNLYKAVIYDEGVSNGFSPEALVIVTVLYSFVIASFGRYQVFRLLPLTAYPIFLAVSAESSLKDICRKMIVVSPFVIFTGIWNPYFDPGIIEFWGISISLGWVSFLSLILKFTLIASATLFMTASVGFDKICRSFSSFGVPEVLVTQLFLLNRYIRLLSEETHSIIRARVFRGGNITLKNAGNICGPLLLRSLRRSRRIHEALMCRGYNGSLYQNQPDQKFIVIKDKLFLFGWTGFFIAARFVDLPEFIGRNIMRCFI